MDNRVIGIFDSGLGGLTCAKEVMNLLPREGIVYFGDTGRVPYGSRSPETILRYVESDINFLQSFEPKLIVIACGTASSVALETMQKKYSVPIMGVVEPASAAAVKATKNGRIGVIGTQGTIRSDKYKAELNRLCPSVTVYSQACPLFVPLVENGYEGHEATRLIAEEYLKPLKESEVDTIILGCTHYPLLYESISDIMEGKVTLIDSGFEAAKEMKAFLTREDRLSEADGKARFYVSDSVDGFEQLGGRFLDKDINGMIEKIDIEKYAL